MTRQNIYQFDGYKTFLVACEQESQRFHRGFRAKLAQAIGCNNAFVSQVLNKGAHFSLEQGIHIARHLALKEDEQNFFLLLIEYERAGIQELREHFQKQLSSMREKFLNIKDRVHHQSVLSAEAQATYYSHWYYAAIHMIVTIGAYRSVASIARALSLKSNLVEDVISFLLSYNLLIEKGGEFLPGPSYLHLDRGSPNISKHHSNWRIAAISSLQSANKGDVHYSTVSTLSEKDVESLRDRLVQVVQDYVQTVQKSSHEESIYGFNLDFFNLINS
jgi:uncharacterized protein (TIGR02147 family)